MKRLFLLFLILLPLGSNLLAQELQACRQGRHSAPEARTAAASGDSIDVIHYDIRLDFLDLSQKKLEGFTEITFLPEYAGMQIFTFDLEQLTVDSVWLNGTSVNWSYNQLILNVISSQTHTLGDTLRARIFYQGQPISDPGGFGGFTFTTDTFFAFNLGVGMTVDPHNFGRCWYPCKDNFTERALYDFHIRTSNTRNAVCNGTLISDTDLLDGTHVMHWRLRDSIPTYLSSVAISNYIAHNATIQAALGPVPFTLHINPQDSLNAVNSMLRLDTTLKMFEHYFGPYVWERLGYVSVPFNGGAMEHATSIAYPRVTLNGSNTFEWLYAHELAHAWFGNLVTCHTAEDMWLNEGFAAWTEGFFYEKLNSEAEGRGYRRQKHRRAMQFRAASDGGFYPLSPVPHSITYGSTVYELGASTVQTLRHYIGDNLFFPAIAAYVQQYSFKTATSEDFRSFMEQHTGVPLTDFFDNWVYNTGTPNYTLDSFVSSPGLSGQYDVTVWLRQRRYGGTYLGSSNKVEIRFYDASGNQQSHTFQFNGAGSSQTIALPFAPDYALLDPEEKCLDANTDEVALIQTTGIRAFAQSFCNLNTLSVTDSARIQVAHHWVSPDPISTIPNVTFGRRYWKIDGDFPVGFSAKMTFTYDGRSTSTASNSNHYLDEGFITYTEDSLILMYRPGPGHAWEEVQGYLKNIANPNDMAGNMTVDVLKRGEYAYAMLDLTTSHQAQDIQQIEFMEMYPNPAENELNIRLNLPTGKGAVLTLLDLQGNQIRKADVFDFQSKIIWKLNGLSAGVYLVSLQMHDGSYDEVKRLMVKY